MFSQHDSQGKSFRAQGNYKGKSDQENNYRSDKKNRESSQNNFKKDKRKFVCNLSKTRCYKCKKLGHSAKNYTQKNPVKDQSNLIKEDLEPTLLMATIEEHHEVFLNERNFKPPKTLPSEKSLWYLDNGASNHMTGKHSRTQFPQQAKYRSKTALDLIYEDLCRPILPPTPSGKRYIFLLVNDYSRYMWEYFLNSKDQAFGVFKEFKTRAEKEHETKIKTFRTYRGREFTSNEFYKYCRENEIIRHLTAPYSPKQNGIIERKNKTILPTASCMIKAIGMPQNFWNAILLLNCTPKKSLEDVTPYEALKGRKPNLQYIRIFGCISFAKVPSQNLTKLDDRSIQIVYLGSEPGSKAYCLFDPITKKIYVSRDVKFKEDETWNWEEYVKDFDSKEPK
nr:zinc finger, CCHC-type [Tanacetum cinerariifolium]